MTVTQMISLFDLVEDKVDTIYFKDNEKVQFLNASQNLLVENIVFSIDEDAGIDANKQVEHILYPLRRKDVVITPATPGVGPILSELDTASGGTMMHVEAVQVETASGSGVFKPATWIKEGERTPAADNTFLAPSTTEPTYSLDYAGLFLEPALASGATVKVSTVMFPTQMINPGTSSDLPLGVHEKIVAGALAIAGIASGDDALIMFSQLTK